MSTAPTAPDPATSTRARHDPYAAIREPNYRQFAAGFLCSSTGLQMMGMALGWDLYERTNNEFILGLVGLCRALPVIAIAIPAGHVIDSADRKKVVVLTQAALALASAGLAAVSASESASVWMILLMVVLTGCARSFNGPARATLLPDIVTPGNFANAVTWNSGAFQLAATGGPLIAGAIIAATGVAWPVYVCTSVLCLVFAFTALGISPRERKMSKKGLTIRDVSAGLSHVAKEKTILSTITLDLFAVLLGGATALMPVYARDILHVGPVGLGVLRASPYIGAFVMALVIAHLPPMRRTGMLLLSCVAAFGMCTIIFGLSTSVVLSIGTLVVLGAVDNVSVVIRHVLVQTRTPSELRGRVSAVNSVFIESSNELGAFESGSVAKLFTPVISVVSGGVGTLLVVLGIALVFPQLRRLDRLDMPPE